MSLLKMISSPYSVLRNLRVCCTLHFGNSVHEVADYNRNYYAFFNQGNAVFEVLIRKIKVQSSILNYVQRTGLARLKAIACVSILSLFINNNLFIHLFTSTFHFHFRFFFSLTMIKYYN